MEKTTVKKNVIVVGVLAFCMQAVPSFAGDAAAVYKTNCITCHGKDRKGSPAMVKMFKVEPVAMDLTAKAVISRSDADLAKIISDGKSKMPAYKDKLTAEEIRSLVSHLKTPVAAGSTSMAAENVVYKANCAACHGKEGQGNPAMAKMFKIPPEALNLSGRIAQHSDAEHIKTISAGRNKMPAFKDKLKAAEIADLAAYLHTLAPTPKPATSGSGEKSSAD